MTECYEAIDGRFERRFVRSASLGAVFVLTITIGLASVASAQEVRINETTKGTEDFARLGTAGTTVRLVWYASNTDPFCGPSVQMRSAVVSGSFTSPERLAICGAQYAGLSVLPSGSFLVINGLLWSRAFDSSATPYGPPVYLPGTGTNPESIDSAPIGSDRHVVVWSGAGALDPVHGQIVLADGQLLGPEVVLSEDGSAGSFFVTVVESSSGGVLVGWSYVHNQFVDTLALREFDSDLVPLGGDQIIRQVAKPWHVRRVQRARTSAGYWLLWDETVGLTEYDVYALRLNAAGAQVGSPFVVNSQIVDRHYAGPVDGDLTGTTVIAWQAVGQDGSGSGAYARRMDDAGTFIEPEFRVNGTTYDAQGPTDVEVFPSGDFLVAWTSFQDPSLTAMMRRFFFPKSLAVAPGDGPANPTSITVTQPDGRNDLSSITPFSTGGFGAQVGTSDVDADALDEVLAGPGPSPVYGPQIRGFEAVGTSIAKVNFYAYGTLRFGARPAGGDIGGDGYGEILTTPGAGAVFGPHVRGWELDGGGLKAINQISFFAYQTLRFGARSVSGDIDGEGFREILTTPGPGGVFGPHVRGFDYDGGPLTAIAKVNFMAFSSGQFGATVAAADYESDGAGGYGDGFDELVVGRGPDPLVGPDVKVYDFDGASIASLQSWAAFSSGTYGCQVAGGDIDAGDTDEIVTAPGADPSAVARVLSWEWDPPIGTSSGGMYPIGPDDFVAFSGAGYGANIAIGRFE